MCVYEFVCVYLNECVSAANLSIKSCSPHNTPFSQSCNYIRFYSKCIFLSTSTIALVCAGYLDQFAIQALRKPFAVVHKAKFGTEPELPSSTNTAEFCLRLDRIDPDDVSKS